MNRNAYIPGVVLVVGLAIAAVAQWSTPPTSGTSTGWYTPPGSTGGTSSSGDYITNAVHAGNSGTGAVSKSGRILRITMPAAGVGDVIAANNLSDLTSAATARTNLGLGTAATNPASAFATASQGTQGATAYVWGDHATNGYLTDESDPDWAAASNQYLKASTAASTYAPIAEPVAAAHIGSAVEDGHDLSTVGTNDFPAIDWASLGGGGSGTSLPAGNTAGQNWMLGSVGTNASWWTLQQVRDYLSYGVATGVGTNAVAFNVSGNVTQQWVVPVGVSNILCVTRGGGGGGNGNASGISGGDCGTVYQPLSVTPLETIYIIVGYGGSYAGFGQVALGGWPGGGDGDGTGATTYEGGGGGYSAVWRGTSVMTNALIAGNGALAAGGGGAAGTSTLGNGGDGGASTGETGQYTLTGTPGAGGTQSSGGSVGGAFLSGGDAISGVTQSNHGGGGGAGWYGGGGANVNGSGVFAGGGGGSNKIGPGGISFRGCNAGDESWTGTGQGGGQAQNGANGEVIIYY